MASATWKPASARDPRGEGRFELSLAEKRARPHPQSDTDCRSELARDCLLPTADREQARSCIDTLVFLDLCNNSRRGARNHSFRDLLCVLRVLARNRFYQPIFIASFLTRSLTPPPRLKGRDPPHDLFRRQFLEAAVAAQRVLHQGMDVADPLVLKIGLQQTLQSQ